MVTTINFEFSNNVSDVTKKPDGAEPSAAVHAAAGDALLCLAADTSSVAASYSPATPVVADHAVIHIVKSTPLWWSTMNVSRTKYPTRGLEQSPRHRATDYETSTEKVRSNRRVSSLFGSDDEDEPPSQKNPQKPSSALIYVRDGDDGVSHSGKGYRGTPVSVGITQGSTDSKASTLSPEKKP